MSHMLVSHVKHVDKLSFMKAPFDTLHMSHVTHIGESCHTCWWVVSRMLTSHFTWRHLLTHHTRVMSHMLTSRVTHWWVMSHVDKSCHTLMSHVTYWWVVSHVDESCYVKTLSDTLHMSHVTHLWVLSHVDEFDSLHMSHVTHVGKSCHACWRVMLYEDTFWHITHESCHTCWRVVSRIEV